jgi:hypothetical protein
VNLLPGKFAVKGGHLVPAFGDDVEEFLIGSFLRFRGTKRRDLQILADHRIATSSCAVTGCTFLLVDLGSVVSERTARSQERNGKNAR